MFKCSRMSVQLAHEMASTCTQTMTWNIFGLIYITLKKDVAQRTPLDKEIS